MSVKTEGTEKTENMVVDGHGLFSVLPQDAPLQGRRYSRPDHL